MGGLCQLPPRGFHRILDGEVFPTERYRDVMLFIGSADENVAISSQPLAKIGEPTADVSGDDVRIGVEAVHERTGVVNRRSVITDHAHVFTPAFGIGDGRLRFG